MASLPNMFCYNSLLLSSSSCTSLYFYTHLPVFSLSVISALSLYLYLNSPSLYAYAKLFQSCLTLCDFFYCMYVHTVCMDYSLPGSSVHEILQARILEWFTMPSSRGSSWPGGIKPCLLCLLHWQTGSSPLSPPGKPIQMNNSWTETTTCLFQLLKSFLLPDDPPWTPVNKWYHISSYLKLL